MTARANDANRGSGERRARRPLVELGLGAASLVGVAAVVSILDQLLGLGSFGAAILGALAVYFLAGVRWDRDDVGEGMPRNTARRAAAGAAAALVVGGLVIAIAGVLGWFHGHGAQASTALVFAAARAVALAVRDELLFRGIPLTAAERAGVPVPIAQGFAGLVSGAAVALVPGATPAAMALAVGSGWFFAVLWTRDQGAWGAVGAHAAWFLLVGSVTHGGLFDLEWTTGELVVGAHAAGKPAWLAAVALAAAAPVVRRLPWPRGSPDDPR